MAPQKLVLKCGNFAVLVDLHVLPLGAGEDTSWFTAVHVEDVAAVVRDSVDQRVKQFTEFLHSRKQPKQKKELAPASALFAKGKNFKVVANFLRRHINLRCISTRPESDLRLFPERYVVCVSGPEENSAHHGNPSPAATSPSEQSRSEYFSRAGETQEAFNSPAKTKKTVLQKLAKQASVQGESSGSSAGEQQTVQRASTRSQTGKRRAAESESGPEEDVSRSGKKALPEMDRKAPPPLTEAASPRKQDLTPKQQPGTENSPPDGIDPHGAPLDFSQRKISQESNKRCKPSDEGENPDSRRAKRTCLGRPPATIQTHSAQISKHDLLSLLPHPQTEAKAESKVFPVSECKKTTLDIELLTLGKRAQRLPLTGNNTAQTNQNRLATSLRGLSVKPASSGSSITSRSTLGEEGSEIVPRTSRLRRLKRS